MADRAALVGYCGSGIAKQRSGRSFEVSFMLRYMQRMVATAVSNGLEHVRIEIARACRDANRNPAEVTLVAVSKTFGADAIEPVIAAGQRAFGENRVQEAKVKWPPLLEKHAGIELHLVGPLQSNKAKEAVTLFEAIHSVDRASLCEALAKEIRKQQRHPILFAEINTGAEPQKAGVLPQDADTFLVACHEKYRLKISGLMCIPPLDEAPGPHFALTAKIAKRNGLQLLSMGMSADFATAIALGATHIRVGSAIFGERSK
jgi:pyridoxal phosphate enzyme (YggS family)